MHKGGEKLANSGREPMLELYLFETTQLIEQLEQIILDSEKVGEFGTEEVNEIFRIMHTIKGSSAMMLYDNISTLAHSVEDMFFYIREDKPEGLDHRKITDLILEAIDFTKGEVEKIEASEDADGDATELLERIKSLLAEFKGDSSKKEESKVEAPKVQYYIGQNSTETSKKMYPYEAHIFFDEGCGMENIRAFTAIHNIKDVASDITHFPENIVDNADAEEIIKNEGFKIFFNTDLGYDEIHEVLSGILFLRDLELKSLLDENQEDEEDEDVEKEPPVISLEEPEIKIPEVLVKKKEKEREKEKEQTQQGASQKQNLISVSVLKLDKLMDLVGELVISEAMVTQHPEIQGLALEGFLKASRQLRKITGELQDTVMSIRMVPLTATFQKMNRIVRDMSKKLNKDVQLRIIGEETEVDKNIIEQISDPLMHVIRNSVDHGLESREERKKTDKEQVGTITLEAKNAGGDVWIIVKDDGKGIDRERVLEKARNNGMIKKPEDELTDKEIYSFIFLPGFSTNEVVTEFSGRGVGMDVAVKNIQKIGGTISVDSSLGEGTTVVIKIPLTLAIIDGMTLGVGNARYTIQTISIKESFRPKKKDIIIDPDGNEMIIIRGVSYPILRLHKYYNIPDSREDISEGILLMVEDEDKGICLFADELIGEQQVVVKALPDYLRKVNGIAGCTLLGDGSISLILDVGGILNS